MTPGVRPGGADTGRPPPGLATTAGPVPGRAAAALFPVSPDIDRLHVACNLTIIELDVSLSSIFRASSKELV